MRNIEGVARSFEKAAVDLGEVPPSSPRISEVVSLRMFLRQRADQVRAGQDELDRAKALLKELASDG